MPSVAMPRRSSSSGELTVTLSAESVDHLPRTHSDPHVGSSSTSGGLRRTHSATAGGSSSVASNEPVGETTGSRPGAHEALENGKGAEQAANYEAALSHYTRAISLSADGDEMTRAEATFLKGQVLFSQQKYIECVPPLRAYLEEDSTDSLAFGDTAKSLLAIAAMESGTDSNVDVPAAAQVGGPPPGPPPPLPPTDSGGSERLANPMYHGASPGVGTAEQGPAGGGSLVVDIPPPPAASGAGMFPEMEPRRRFQPSGDRTLQSMCIGQARVDQGLCLASCCMVVVICVLFIYGYAA